MGMMRCPQFCLRWQGYQAWFHTLFSNGPNGDPAISTQAGPVLEVSRCPRCLCVWTPKEMEMATVPLGRSSFTAHTLTMRWLICPQNPPLLQPGCSARELAWGQEIAKGSQLRAWEAGVPSLFAVHSEHSLLQSGTA